MRVTSTVTGAEVVASLRADAAAGTPTAQAATTAATKPRIALPLVIVLTTLR
jgi:hypothetical protein